VSDKQKIEEFMRQKEHAPIAVFVDVQCFFARTDSEFVQVFQELAPGKLDDGNWEDLSRWLKEIRKRLQRSAYRDGRLKGPTSTAKTDS
jgi:hypothetical protein